jgi:hypothetical protein
MRRLAVLLLPGLLVSSAPAADSADVGTFKKILATASAWSSSGPPRKGFDPATRRRLDDLAGQVADPALRARARQLVAELEPACVLQARVRFLRGEIKRLKGKAVTEPGGPAWLRPLVGPEEMGVFTRLTEIDLNEHTDGHAAKKPRPKGEAVTDEWLRHLAGLPDLRRLELSGTAVSDVGLAALRDLKNLEWLNVCLTPVTNAGLKHLAGLTNLRRLVICSTRVTGSGFKDVPDWPKIESINLHSCPVSDEGLAALSRFKNLQRLEIVHSRVTDAGLKHLGKLTNLRQLHVASHGTTRAGLGFVANLGKLVQLDLYEELASNEGLAQVGKLTGLKILNLHVGPADDAGLASLRQLRGLEELTLGGLGKVTDAAVEHLIRLKGLKRLQVNGTRITDAGFKRLRQALPTTEIKK